MPTIRVSDELYERLSLHADGFDTPANVIEKLLNSFEGTKTSSKQATTKHAQEKPELIFSPNEAQFRESLIEGKVATRTLYFSNGSTETTDWEPARFTRTSNLRGNIWSGALRGWKSADIVKAEFIAGK